MLILTILYLTKKANRIKKHLHLTKMHYEDSTYNNFIKQITKYFT